MSDEIDWSVRTPHVKHRQCPGCKSDLHHFRLTALQMPVEQFAIPALLAVNAAIQSSVRFWGNQNLHEMQCLVFISTCDSCTLVSFWDFGVEELAEIIASNPHPPFATIAWGYAPEIIRGYLEKAPSWLKPQFEALLKAITPQEASDAGTQ